MAGERALTPHEIDFLVTMAGRSIAIVFLALIVVLFLLARRRNPSDVAVGAVLIFWLGLVLWSFGYSLVTGGETLHLPYPVWFALSLLEIGAMIVLIRERIRVERARGELDALELAYARGDEVVQRVEHAAQRAEEAAGRVEQAAEQVTNGHGG